MAALSTTDRTRVWRGLMRHWSMLPAGDPDKPVSASKFELYDPNANTGMLADMDNWADSASGAAAPSTGLNSAINASYRNKFTIGQKGLAFAAIMLARTGNMDLVRSILGVID